MFCRRTFSKFGPTAMGKFYGFMMIQEACKRRALRALSCCGWNLNKFVWKPCMNHSLWMNKKGVSVVNEHSALGHLVIWAESRHLDIMIYPTWYAEGCSRWSLFLHWLIPNKMNSPFGSTIWGICCRTFEGPLSQIRKKTGGPWCLPKNVWNYPGCLRKKLATGASNTKVQRSNPEDGLILLGSRDTNSDWFGHAVGQDSPGPTM